MAAGIIMCRDSIDTGFMPLTVQNMKIDASMVHITAYIVQYDSLLSFKSYVVVVLFHLYSFL